MVAAAYQMGGSTVLLRDYGKLKTSANHLNDFILHVRVTKDGLLLMKFSFGITDSDLCEYSLADGGGVYRLQSVRSSGVQRVCG